MGMVRKMRRRGGRGPLGKGPTAEDLEILDRVGYDTDDKAEVMVGLMALKAAREIAAQARRAAGGEAEFEIEEIVPLLSDEQATLDGIEGLAWLLRADEELSDVRLPLPLCQQFMEENPEIWSQGAEDEESEEEAEAHQAKVEDFLARTRPALPSQLRPALLDAATRYPDDPELLGALAHGLMILETTALSTEAANPLLSLLLQLSLDEFYETVMVARDALLFRDALETLDVAPEDFDWSRLANPEDELTASLTGFLAEGRPLVRLPLASALPYFFAEMKARAAGELSDEDFDALVDEVAAGFHEEDERLYAEALSDALDHAGPQNGAVEGGTLLLLAALDAGAFRHLAAPALAGALGYGVYCFLPGEDTLFTELDESLLLPPATLERHGDILAAHGYPALARRTWQFCSHHGPLPESVAAKLAALTATE